MDMVLTHRGLRMGNRILPCSIGRGGLTQHKREGDGATPVGTYRIVGMLYRADRMACPTDWAIPIKPNDLWSDDVRDVDYNMMVRAPHSYSHEKMRRADPMYDLVILTDWNWPYRRRVRDLPFSSTHGAVHTPQLPDVLVLAMRIYYGLRNTLDIKQG